MTNEEHTTNTGVRKAQERLHIDNTTKSGFNALDSIGKSDSSHARCFTYVASDGSQKKLPIVYPEVSYVTNFLLNEDLPGIYHSSFAIVSMNSRSLILVRMLCSSMLEHMIFAVLNS